jgi:peptide deformylase
MALLPILEVPDPRLKVKAAPVAEVDAELRKTAADMLETMYKAPGIGLAGTQVGVMRRICVVDVADRKAGEEPRPMVLVNPDITWRSEDEDTVEEGCLSLPGQYADVTRPKGVRVRYRDLEGAEQEVEADGLLARCLQHEIDHLDGVLFVDRISALKRNMILRKLAKARRVRA